MTRNNTILQQLDIARGKLLDLTLRNSLLNFRSTTLNTVEVIQEVPREIYKILVLDETPMTFLPSQNHATQDQEDTDDEVRSAEDRSVLWHTPAEIDDLHVRHTDLFLQTSMASEKLARSLFSVYQKSSTHYEETGVSPLYLALGFLKWREAEQSEKVNAAPLVMIPVELDRDGAMSPWRLQWSQNELGTNISLQAKLTEFGVELPEFEMPADRSGIDAYLAEVERAIGEHKDWRVDSDIYLGFFSFSKFMMHRDLDPSAWPTLDYASHPLLKALFDDTDREPGSIADPIDPRTLDDIDPRSLHYILDADPSQASVIEEIKKGGNLVVEGPPGTGKSQTIANCIGELLAEGKKVLFVSEKMAALEVVKDRLESKGLGSFCLELHSKGARPRTLLTELEQSLLAPGEVHANHEDQFVQFENTRRQLNQLSNAMRKPLGESQFSPIELLGKWARLAGKFAEGQLPDIEVPNPESITRLDLDHTLQTLDEYEAVLATIGPPNQNPWWGCAPDAPLPRDLRELDAELTELENIAVGLQNKIGQLASRWCLVVPSRLADMRRLVADGTALADTPLAQAAVAMRTDWENPELARELCDKVSDYQSNLANSLFGSAVAALTLDRVDQAMQIQNDSLRVIKPTFWRDRSFFNSALKDTSKTSRAIRLDALTQLRRRLELENEIDRNSNIGQTLFGDLWNGASSDPTVLGPFIKWVATVRECATAKRITPNFVDQFPTNSSYELSQASTDIGQRVDLFSAKFDSLAQRLRLSTRHAFGGELEYLAFARLLQTIRSWKESLPNLATYAKYVETKSRLAATRASAVIGVAEKEADSADKVKDIFEFNFVESMLGVAYRERPELQSFHAEEHGARLTQFRSLDETIIKLNSERLRAHLLASRPTIAHGASPQSETGILLGEFKRKRGHKPIRKLLSLCGSLVQDIKPCFMMSPISIAQYLHPTSFNFDIVLFDEASQVRPEDALGALLRGRQVVVFGDSRQLPPTSFFYHEVESDETEEETVSLGDLESILTLSSIRLPQRQLCWHYRSRHESLIAVSNQEFYDNKLLVYPCAQDSSPNIGLQFRHHPETTYDRGRSGVNRAEAKLIAEAAVQHYRDTPHRSLGVGAFNSKQQRAIEEEVELLRRQDPDIDLYFSREREGHFFVKNLETIQGDERDTIFISIGFGVDGVGRFSQNFGPLNQEGGHRRLNVLITRAKRKCVVFSNFSADKLELTVSSSRGIVALKTFLKYAETRRLDVSQPLTNDTDSPFEDSVYEYLSAQGFEVRKQIGCAGFRVDLAIVDPRNPGRYCLGIECDGAKYHSAATARERDRLREGVLRDLGWNIYRVWSSDWFRRNSEAKESLLRAASASVAAPPTSVPVPTHAQIVSPAAKGQDPATVMPPDVQRIDIAQAQPVDILDGIATYETLAHTDIDVAIALQNNDVKALIPLVIDIVHTEAPIHEEEVATRVRAFAGLKRTGSRISETVEQAVAYAGRNGLLERRKPFLFTRDSGEIVPRWRNWNVRLETVSDEELISAARHILGRQRATPAEELAKQTAKLIGVGRVTSGIVARILETLETNARQGHLVIDAQERFSLP